MSSRNPCCSYRQNHHSKTLQTHSLPHTPSTEPAGETHPAAEQNTEKGKTEWKDKPAGHSQTDGGAGFSPCSEREAGERPKPPPRRRHSRAKHCPSDSASSKSYKPRDHPWMELIQPGPWAKLPPVPPPALPTHPASIPSLSQLWLRRWSSPFNPFEEKKEEDEGLKNDGMSWRSASQLADAASVNAKSATGMVKFPEMSRLDSDGVVDSQVSGLGSLSLNDSEASRLGDVSVADSELPKLGEDASSNVCEVSTNRYLSTKDGGISSGNSEDSKPDEGLTANSEVLCLVAAAVSSEDVCAATQTSSLLDSQLELCTLNERSSCLADSLSEAKPCSAQTECSVADVSSVAEFSCVANVSQACSCPTVSGFPENASLPSVPNLAPETYDPAEAKLESAVVLQQSEIASSSHLAASERLKTNQAQQHSLPQSSPELASSNHKPCVTNSPTSSHLLANRVKASCLLPQTSSCEERSSSSSSSSSLQPPPPTETKKSCKENPFNLKAPPVDSFSHRCTTAPSSTQTSAPGHGFPLIRRKVQADGYMLEEELQRQQGVLEDRLQELERQGQELEKKIHKCAPGKQEEELLVDWFTLIHEKHTLVRRDAELVHILKQQELEQKQADVEFQLRSLLNKPEREWTRDDEISEQKLTFELVAIIEQRDDIISSQEKDRQREQEKDDLLDAVIKKRDFYRHVKPQLLSFGGNLKPLRALKMLKALKARGSNRKEKRSSSISLS
ncbi:uncharacterized protein LOC118804543 isoform X2 [Colossoma macropomum]|uniref:uncharacterized protein LOC118804543 isoform X2 n=1 Tax=Colossoma macropomum TaxID=42526 RepID=UPI001864AEBD|nr:uncharacterized protein LOC118804543 isoform X2 [Colossoma macropomum]